MKFISFLSVFLFTPFLSNLAYSFNDVEYKTNATNNEGLTIKNNADRYSLKKVISTPIRTYEAWIDTYQTETNQGSTILANYTEEYNPGISFRIYTHNASIGKPQLNIRYDRNTQKQFTINANICGTGKRHVAYTISNTEIKGYLDGVLKNTWSFNGVIPEIDIPYCVGGDNRSSNSWWFRGTIYSISAFSCVRTQGEIYQDMIAVEKSDELLIGFDFVNNGLNNVSDESNPLVTFLYNDSFVDRSTYDYTFAVIPDTQSIMYYYPDNFSDIYNFIIDKKEEMNISFAIGLGDITEMNTDSEWSIARNNIYKLKDNDIPFSLIRGNHDVGTFGTTEEWRLLKFSQYFDNDTYRSQMSGFYNDKIDNSYRLFEVCNVKYLLINLDYGASDDVLDWANFIVESYPNHNVIVTTHAFLFRDGTFLDENDVYPPSAMYGYNNGDDIWNKFISKHKNISLVLCGHDPDQNIIKSMFIGDNGNTVTSLLIDPQYYDSKCLPLGCVAFLHFSNSGRDISIDYYSTIQQKFFRHFNQLEFELDVVDDSDEEINYVDKCGGNYHKVVSDNQLKNEALVVLTDENVENALHVLGNSIIPNNINSFNGESIFNEKCDTFILEENNQLFYLRTINGQYLALNNDYPYISDLPFALEIEIEDEELFIKNNGRYIFFSNIANNFVVSSNRKSVSLFCFEGLFSNSLEEVNRYICKFMNSYVCGFDEYTSASIYIWNVLKDDYNRLSEEAKDYLLNMILENDLEISDFLEKYSVIIEKHKDFDNFLSLNIVSKTNEQLLSNKENIQIFILIICLPLSTISLILAGKKRKSK